MEIKTPQKQYRKNSHSVYSCIYHVIFCPKYRRKVLVNNISDRLSEIIDDVCLKYDCIIIEKEILPDHVHLLLDINPDVGVKNVITKIKGTSSRILRNEFPELKKRIPSLWTRGKFISTVGSVSLDVVKQYIENQKYE